MEEYVEISWEDFLDTYKVRFNNKWFFINGVFLTNDYAKSKKGELVLARKHITCTLQDELGHQFMECVGIVDDGIIRLDVVDRSELVYS